LLFTFKNPKSDNPTWEAWHSVNDLFKSNDTSSRLWDIYHEAKIVLAQRGVSIDENSVDMIKALEKKINDLQEEVSKLQERIGEQQDRINDFLSNEFLKRSVVSYSPLTKMSA
jgi:ribosome-associated translation inhibitor RaiA